MSIKKIKKSEKIFFLFNGEIFEEKIIDRYYQFFLILIYILFQLYLKKIQIGSQNFFKINHIQIRDNYVFSKGY